MISTITATQVYKAVSPIIRKNITHLFIYRLRNHADLEAIIKEMSAIYDKKDIATNVPWSNWRTMLIPLYQCYAENENVCLCKILPNS